ncbi:MAG: sarcosine oxidase subunit alpha family protein [Alphaproteobacteria bacterium]|nr:sarcosine oxidase subunit alpha family protein [Alphaproteobacteria bacterium]
MSQPFRGASGGRIERARQLSFTFDGRRYQGHAGDTLASALMANGVRIIARSQKYHRPRGILSAGAEEPNAVVQLGTGAGAEPNVRATEIELRDGLVAGSVNAWPSAAYDVGAVAGLLSPLLVAGFYYKTFMAPGGFWQSVYEPLIRRMAGLGRAPSGPDPDIYDHMHAHVDVLVAGGGPAGLAAAGAAARTGARVMLADEQTELGGSLLGGPRLIAGQPAPDWVAAMAGELAGCAEARILTRATVFGYYDHNWLGVLERRADRLGPSGTPGRSRERLWHVRAKQVVLATGAHERPLIFPGNDRPGVMLAGAAATYAHRYGVLAGRRAVIATNNDSAYGAALDLAAAGIQVLAIVDARWEAALKAHDTIQALGIERFAGAVIQGALGRRSVRGVRIVKLDGRGDAKEIACDLVLMSGGWSPAIHLFSQSGGRPAFDPGLGAFVPGVSHQAERSAGAAGGTMTLAGALGEGYAAGAKAAADAGFGDGRAPEAPHVDAEAGLGVAPLWPVPEPAGGSGQRGKAFVDFQADVTDADVRLAAREGFEAIEHMKRYTAAGLGTDQGKTGNVNAIALLSAALAKPIAAIGTTTFRPPYTPVAYGAMAGRNVGALLDPARVTPIHDWHASEGAVFEDVGQWKRPWYFPQGHEDMAGAVRRECLAVRNAVGVLDASTLGKIDIQGPDAGRFLDRVYTNLFSNLSLGRCRYGLMLKEDGMVMDDGVTTRLGPDHFLMTTTTGNAARVLDWLEEWLQTEWPELEVYCTSVTEQWATITIAGPKARDLLHDLAPDLALGKADFPFLAMREATVAGVPARVFRVSFTGEMSYEINVPASHGRGVWESVMAAGAAHGIAPFGTETMHVLRAEKGFIVVGHETDGTVTPLDLGMDWIVSKRKDFIGRRSLARADIIRPDRKQLVGLLPLDGQAVLPEGAQLVLEPRRAPPVPMIGHVTSSYWSATLGRGFALALVAGGRTRAGTVVYAPLESGIVAATITLPGFYDPDGHRLHD